MRSLSPQRILILEDMPELLLLEEHVVRLLWPQIDITTCLQLGKALEYLRTQEVDLVLADLRLPDSRNPAKTIQVLKAALPPTCPIIVFSGYVSELEAIEMLQAGAESVVPKGANKPAEKLTRALAYTWARASGREARKQLVAPAELAQHT